jgi:hypothetical protein
MLSERGRMEAEQLRLHGEIKGVDRDERMARKMETRVAKARLVEQRQREHEAEKRRRRWMSRRKKLLGLVRTALGRS